MDKKKLDKNLERCVRCGRCLPVCPVYGETGWEGSSARGKITLMKSESAGRSDFGSRMKDLLSHCLLCGACAEVCSGGAKGDEAILAGRELAVGTGGLERLRSLLAKDLLARGLAARGLWKGKNLFIKNVPEHSGLHFRFPLPAALKGRHLPQPADKSFLEDAAGMETGPADGPRVALFVGCVSNYLRPKAARAAVRVLQAAGAKVWVPPDQVCCGKPAAGAGDTLTAKYLAKRNLKALASDKIDYIVSFCATCSEQLKEYGRHYNLPGAENLVKKVRPLSDLLVKELGWMPSGSGSFEKKRVFYHDPCHLRRKQGIHQEPRKLLAALPDIELVGADEPPVCCGYGGVFNLWHYPMSIKLFNKRAETMAPYQPDLAVTSCSGCWLQFTDGLAKLGDIEPKPLVELIEERGL